MIGFKRGNFVTCISDDGPRPHPGKVIRRAKDGSWVDVFWLGGWSKRMRPEYLRDHGASLASMFENLVLRLPAPRETSA